uniref:Fatty acyl-CoA reductase n=1 Tax=Glossina morsitans morsitans TaxID=37546 RepID=A0A1B0G433_GLOMM
MKSIKDFTVNDDDLKKMSITDFYKDQEIFITGGSGFIGKALIEKLLRSFPSFKKMFILLRPKKDKTADERLQELLDSSIFQRARDEQPESFKKIHAIPGDCRELGLSISNEDLKRIENVTIVFHSAANVRFDVPLKDSIFVNLRGTHEILKIAETMTKLKAFIHVSTLYSNVDQPCIYEKILPNSADWRTTIKLAETLDGKTLDILFKKYSSNHPNTYTFAKSLSEHVVNDYKNKLPVLVYRVAMVVSSVDEPSAGWLDNLNGPCGLFLTASLGLSRTAHISPHAKLNVIPCDATVHGLIISAYAAVSDSNFATNSKASVVVLNSCYSNESLTPLWKILRDGEILAEESPSEKMVWFPGGNATSSFAGFFIRFLFGQLALAILLDVFVRLKTGKPLLVKLQRRIFFLNKILHKFMSSDWMVENDKYKSLSALITQEDKNKLNLRLNFAVDKEFLKNGLAGGMKFILNVPTEASESTILRYKILFILNYLLQFVTFICLVWIIKKIVFYLLY